MTLLVMFVTFLTVVGLVVTSAASVENKATDDAAMSKRASSSCDVNGHVYRHGDVFTIGSARCIKYQCKAGSYDFYEEGCEMDNQCWPANRQFRHKCRKYMCRAYEVGSGYKRYEIIPWGHQMCEDINGYCYQPGQRFTYVIKGRLRSNCTCRPTGSTINYYCYN